MSNPFQIYYSQRVKNLFNYLHDYELKGDDVSLHDLRIEMKKLRAIISFLKTVYAKQKMKKVSHKIRAIFQEAGEIREYQLLLQWLAKNELGSFDQQYLPQHTLQSMADDFHQQAARNKQVLKEVIDEVGKYVQATNQILAEQYVVDLHAQIETITRKQPATAEWHALRKLIKQWMYALNWIRNGEDTKTDTDLYHYKKLQEAIGYWHDAEVIKDTLYQKQIYLSQDMEVQKDFTKACAKLNQSLRYRERQVGELLTPSVSPPGRGRGVFVKNE